jgi:hypothetical protein
LYWRGWLGMLRKPAGNLGTMDWGLRTGHRVRADGMGATGQVAILLGDGLVLQVAELIRNAIYSRAR